MPLINPQAIALLRSNAYNAAKAIAPTADVSMLYTISADYVKFVQPRTNRALMTNEIMHDPTFLMIANKVKNAAKADTGEHVGIFGKVEGVLAFGALAVGGWWLYKKYGKKIFKHKSKRRSSKRKSGGGFIASLGSTAAPKVGV